MSKIIKILEKILDGKRASNVDFSDLTQILNYLNFIVRIKGSHFIFTREDISEIINIQEGKNGKAKIYQVRQVKKLIEKYDLSDEIDDENIDKKDA